jgi:hypothetical protein
MVQASPAVPRKVENVARVADIIILLSGLTQQDVLVTDVVSNFCKTPNATDGFYFELNQAEKEKRSTYMMYGITLHHFPPLAFGRTKHPVERDPSFL